MTTTHDVRRGLLDVEGLQVQYWERGEGEPILLAHAGVFGDWFAPVFGEPALDGHRVVRVHRPGYGGSTVPGAPFGLDDHARVLVGVLDGLGIERAVWVGHSSGGSIALQAAVDAPGRVAGLVLLEPAPYPPGPSAADLGEHVIGPAVGAATAGDVATAADVFLRGVVGEHWRDDVRRRLGDDAPAQVERDAGFFFDNEIRAAQGWRLTDADAARITAPVVLAYGAEGHRVTRVHAETVELLAGMLPAAGTVALPGVGHGMPLEDPAGVARFVAETVDRWVAARG